MSISHLVLQLLLALCAATSSYGRPVQMTLQHRLLSRVTGHYLAITKSGRVHANGDINTENPGYRKPNHVQIASVKYAGNSWFLVVTPEDKIRAQVPDGENEVIEEVHLPDGSTALRFVNYDRISRSFEGSGLSPASEKTTADFSVPHSEDAASTEPPRECYLGFSDELGRTYGRAQCYSDTSSVHVRMHMIPHE
ncbi:hypothetical protein GBAR_LOCUS641 [Geodia barretti]|uniref:Uncharacterized protein n=1 Tax=Geodia barretti TaxID=519541 RepID=A0AA35VT52_GEOBA|nr:hypothetical protein GBAR_LOCUS641 [Geodia barretti]